MDVLAAAAAAVSSSSTSCYATDDDINAFQDLMLMPPPPPPPEPPQKKVKFDIKSRLKIKLKPKHWCAFPVNDISTYIEKIEYPKKNKFADPANVKVFVLYMNNEQKIYYDKRKLTQKYLKHMTDVGKGSRIFGEFYPEEINWNKVVNMLKRNHLETQRQNTDKRTCFKFGNKFLVKPFFTFGQRTVKPGRCHIYQTLNVPLLFFLVVRRTALTKVDGFFPFDELKCYDQRILLPNGVYKIPSGVTYFIMTTQKTFFSLDVVEENFQIPANMKWVNPIENPVYKLPDIYERPLYTPYIEEEEEDEIFEDESMEQQQQQQIAIPSLENTVPEQSMGEPDEQSIPEPSCMDQQQITYYILPQQPILEKNILVNNPDFTKEYQKLSWKQYDDPKMYDTPIISSNNELEQQPLDLTITKTTDALDFLNDLQTYSMDENMDKWNEILSELCEQNMTE